MFPEGLTYFFLLLLTTSSHGQLVYIILFLSLALLISKSQYSPQILFLIFSRKAKVLAICCLNLTWALCAVCCNRNINPSYQSLMSSCFFNYCRLSTRKVKIKRMHSLQNVIHYFFKKQNQWHSSLNLTQALCTVCVYMCVSYYRNIIPLMLSCFSNYFRLSMRKKKKKKDFPCTIEPLVGNLLLLLCLWDSHSPIGWVLPPFHPSSPDLWEIRKKQ